MLLDAGVEIRGSRSKDSLQEEYRRVRERTLELTDGLSDEDMMLQSMPDASPTKWHLAHTTWFFEAFLLQGHIPDYRLFDSSYAYLFNSYYETLGQRHPRPQRGLLSRPPLSEVLAYRDHVDQAMNDLLEEPSESVSSAVEIGLHHEMQHQELILTDIKHALSLNPYAFLDSERTSLSATGANQSFSEFEGGIVWVGADPEAGFSYDCEQPRHQVLIHPFRLRNSPVTNGEWLDFINDGGYERPELWLSDGWARCQHEAWQMPLYWQRQGETWRVLTLNGPAPLNPAAPVCHISFYEADAFARWAGCRLPTEFEWEYAAQEYTLEGNFSEANHWHPRPASTHDGLTQLYGDVWEWTQSSFSPYPGFSAPGGALAEYNGKFMANQYVLRGGSCVTPAQQMRSSYRNFFYPHQRWQFSGLRLAE
ncbi:ergothioneine biosynthesis protein EgtB [Marinimicrobium sp. ABcell2]|uniref:ergothioneine biosynthesis protein EgtB n=1 Tax=Marinimicrobium sp. ABcell2 TaxID=3069751 RepID=UPI0027AF4AEB|nr:ergothioneine biosynthesis protein EgtB [Marinimicrobium sp. ABcell2]MDQ2078226.1 ergothioneine biosynthesis protein EgtB [Marinimicrobium sp. ABcell2]